MNRIFTICFVLLSIAIMHSILIAQQMKPEPIGSASFSALFKGGPVSHLVVVGTGSSKRYIISTPNAGMHVSRDTGNTWTPLTDTLPSYSGGLISVHPLNPRYMMMATGNTNDLSVAGWGVMVSYDSGATWTMRTIPKGLSSSQPQFPSNDKYSISGFTSIVPHPTNIGEWTCTSPVPTSTSSSMYYATTSDTGRSFKLITPRYGPASNNRFIMYEPSNPTIQYQWGGIFWGGMYGIDRSTKGFELPTLSNRAYTPVSLTLSPLAPQTVYVLALTTNASNQRECLVLRSLSRGDSGTWTLHSTITQDIANEMIVRTAANIGNNPPSIRLGLSTEVLRQTIQSVPENTSTLFIQLNSKVLRSDNSGQTWSVIADMNSSNPKTKLPDVINSLTVVSSSELYCSTQQGVMKTLDGGKSWVNITEKANIQVVKFVETNYQTDKQELRVYGNGITAVLTGNGIWKLDQPFEMKTRLVDLKNPQYVYALRNDGRIYRSDDGGVTFNTDISPAKEGPNGQLYSMEYDEESGTLYCGSFVVYRSFNNGTTWDQESPRINGKVLKIVTGYGNRDAVHILTPSQVLVSNDRGQLFNQSSPTAFNEYTDMVINKSVSNTIFRLDLNKSIELRNLYPNPGFVSTPQPSLQVRDALLLRDKCGTRIFIATDYGAFYVNGLDTLIRTNPIPWKNMLGSSNPAFGVTSLESKNDTLYFAVQGKGVWATKQPDSAPILQFNQSATETCPEQTIQFVNTSINDGGKQRWRFEGGTPETSLDRIVQVQYIQRGLFNVSLVASSNCATDSLVRKSVNVISPPRSAFSASKTEICTGETITFSMTSSDVMLKQWNVTGGTITTGAGTPTITVSYDNEGTYTTNLEVSNLCGSATSQNLPVKVWKALTKPTLVNTDNSLSVSTPSSDIQTYQWFLNKQPLNGATNSTYKAVNNGSYSVRITNGVCSAVSDELVVTVSSIDDNTLQTAGISISPTIVHDMVRVVITPTLNDATISLRVVDVQGKKVYENESIQTAKELLINAQRWSSGTYIVIIDINGKSSSMKIIKE